MVKLNSYLGLLSSVLLLLLLHWTARTAEDEGDSTASDLATLQKHGVGTRDADLFAFFHKRTVFQVDLDQIPHLIQGLGSEDFGQRELASLELRRMGFLAHQALKQTLETSRDPEVLSRCRMLLEEDEATTVLAAVKQLMARKIPGTAGLLLGYIPACSNDLVRDWVCAGIFDHARIDGKLDEELIRGIQDGDPMRRSTAALVLIRTAPEYRESIRKLMSDPSLTVRNAVTRALIEAGDKQAIPFLIGLLKDLPDKEAWEVEDLLFRLAGPNAVKTHLPFEIDESSRLKSYKNWESWWQSIANSGLDSPGLPFLGRSERILSELTGGSQNRGRIVCLGADNTIRWQFDNVDGPMDVQPLPNGHLLVAEINQNRVTERDRTGRIHWEFKTNDSPMTAQRLRNGNIFIATYTEFMEVTPESKILFRQKIPGEQIYCAQRLSNGIILLVTSAGHLVEMNSVGKRIRTIPCGDTSNWGSVEKLQNGHYLVCRCGKHEVVELDQEGNVQMRLAVEWPTWAGVSYSGTIQIACANSGQVIEVSRLGKELWRHSSQNRPSRFRLDY